MSSTAFSTVATTSASANSEAVRPMSKSYSIQANISDGSTYAITAKLQVSIDGTNFVDLADSEQTGLTGASDTVHWDVDSGFHNFVRVAFTRTSGSYSAECFLSNGLEQWETP